MFQYVVAHHSCATATTASAQSATLPAAGFRADTTAQLVSSLITG
jgi:hypothetical protein